MKIKDEALLKITILGTGTSQGVPIIGCSCEVCHSTNPCDKRLRVSILVEYKNTSLVVDAGPDFRQQMLRANVKKLDAILITHEHNDHIIGLDDVRPFNFMNMTDMPVYAIERVQKELRSRFDYIFKEHAYPGAPMVQLMPIHKSETIHIGDLDILPIEVLHGELPIVGFRFGDFTYLTDVKMISESEMRKVFDSKILVLNALHHYEHHSHLNLKEALDLIKKLNPEKAYLTHISHYMGLHEEVSKSLPSNVELAYDGLEISIPLS